ncbi:GroES protein [Salix suchowensis]|nr:GroES protein [Salix suchowensis]
MSTHRAVATVAKGSVDEILLPTGAPGAGEVLLKHSYAAMIAYDTYQADLGYGVDSYPLVLGITASGVVVDVGPGVTGVSAGDRVVGATIHTPLARGLQEYSIQPRNLIAKIPHELPFDQAATIPTTSSPPSTQFSTSLDSPSRISQPSVCPNLGLWCWCHFRAIRNPTPLRRGIHEYNCNSICEASRLSAITRASSVFDYRSPTLVEDISKAAGGDGKVQYAIDSITSQGTIATIAKVISPSGTLALLLPIKEGSSVRGAPEAQMLWELPDAWNVLPKGTKYVSDEFLKENLMPKILPRLLDLHLVKPSKVLLLDQGSFKERVAAGLDLLRNNRVSGEKAMSFHRKTTATVRGLLDGARISYLFPMVCPSLQISIRSFLLPEPTSYVSANDRNRRALIIDSLRPEYVVAFNFVMWRRSTSSCSQAEFLDFPLLPTLIEKCSIFLASGASINPASDYLAYRLEYSSKSVTASPRDDHWAASMAGAT